MSTKKKMLIKYFLKLNAARVKIQYYMDHCNRNKKNNVIAQNRDFLYKFQNHNYFLKTVSICMHKTFIYALRIKLYLNKTLALQSSRKILKNASSKFLSYLIKCDSCYFEYTGNCKKYLIRLVV